MAIDFGPSPRIESLIHVDALPAETALALGGLKAPGRPGGYLAKVQSTASDLRAMVSKVDGEDNWCIDALYKGSFPVYAHGNLARYCAKDRVECTLAHRLDCMVANGVEVVA